MFGVGELQDVRLAGVVLGLPGAVALSWLAQDDHHPVMLNMSTDTTFVYEELTPAGTGGWFMGGGANDDGVEL